MIETPRTGVRFVFTNLTDPSRADDFGAWYDSYGAALTRPGFLINNFRFENPSAAGTDRDPRFAAVYDIVTPDPAEAWPATETSPNYPRSLFDDPRSLLVSPAFRGSYALVRSLQTPRGHGALTGIYVALTDGDDDISRHRWPERILQTGFYYAASRYRLIEGNPEPAPWLDILETDQPDPLDAFPHAVKAGPPDASDRRGCAGSFQLVSAYP